MPPGFSNGRVARTMRNWSAAMHAKSSGVSRQRTSTRRRITPLLVHGASIWMRRQEFIVRNLQTVNAGVNGSRFVVPVAKRLGVLRTEIFLPAIYQELRMRFADAQLFLVRQPVKRLFLPRGVPQDRVDQRSA